MNADNPLYVAAASFLPLIVAIVFHEVAHGWAALAFGDTTAKERRRLSFLPWRHVDPFGTIVLPLMLAVAHAPIFGWAKPVPVDARRMRNPRLDMVLVALAGPAMNLVLAVVSAVLLGLLLAWLGDAQATGVNRFVADNLFNFIGVNVFLALFNLLPIPPFDGGHVVQGLLPRPLAGHYAKLGRFGFLLVIGLLVILPWLVPGADIVQRLVGPPVTFVMTLLLGISAAIA